jgi:hypothetical protein
MIESRIIWETAERFDLYALTDEELEALLAKHADAVITAAACYILDATRVGGGRRSLTPAGSCWPKRCKRGSALCCLSALGSPI